MTARTFSPEEIDRFRRSLGDRCFACGRDNPVGLRMDGFRLRDGWTEAEVVLRPELVGFGDRIHGGILATALDEIAVWAAILAEGTLALTATLDLRFRRPLVAGTTVVARGRILERRGRRMRATAQIVVPDGSRREAGLDARDGPVAVEATALLLAELPIDDALAAVDEATGPDAHGPEVQG